MTTLSKSKLRNQNSMINLLLGLLLTSTSLYTIAANAAPIYKVIDKSTGQVTFTDNPQSYEQQAGKQISETGVTTGQSFDNRMNTSQSNSTQASNNSTSVPLAPSQAAPPAVTVTSQRVPVNYQLTMVEPSEERAYQRPGQVITVNLQMSPALQIGDSISIYIDDKLISQGITASIATIDLNPGEHTIQAVIQNKAGQVINSISRTVYVIQNTAILRQKQQLAEQVLAYQRLPWQQKLLIKLRQKDTNATQ